MPHIRKILRPGMSMKLYFWIIAWQGSLLFLFNQALAQQAPYHGQPVQLPAVIQAEDFDLGGEGVAFHVAVPAIPGEDPYRYTVVPISPTTDTSGGYDVHLRPDDWLEYTVEVPETGIYEFRARLRNSWGYFELSLDGEDLTGEVLYFPDFVKEWSTGTKQPLVLPAGIHTLRLTIKYWQSNDGGTATVNWIDLRKGTSVRPADYLAGIDVPGFTDGPGLTAQFSTNITGMDVDAEGNVYLADAGNFRIRKISPTGLVTTLAGDGMQGWMDGPGSTARFHDLTAWGNSLVVEGSGTVYVLDRPPGTNTVRRISPDGTVSTYYQVKQEQSSTFEDIAVGHAEGDLLLVEYRPGAIPAPSSTACLRLAQHLSVSTLFWTGPKSGGGPSGWIQDLSVDNNGNFVYSAMTEFDHGQIRWRTASGEETLLFDRYSWTNCEWVRNAAVTSAGDIYFIAQDIPPGGQRCEGLSILRLKPMEEEPSLIYQNPALGKLALEDDGTVYTMEGNRLIRLSATPSFGLALRIDGGGTATASPPGPLFLPGTAVHVTAQPSEGWTFHSWEGDRLGTIPELDVIMTNHFIIRPLFVTTVQTPATNGFVLREPDLEFYPYQQRLNLTAQPDEGFEFIRWSDGSTNAVREFNVDDPLTLAPVFSALPSYTVTASVLGGVGGIVTAQPVGPEYYRDTVVRFNARPVPGYIFQVWLDGNLSNPRTHSVQSDTALFAVFEPGEGTAPQLTSTPPAIVTKAAGSSLTLRTTVEGSDPLECQWYHNGVPMPGATSFELTLTNLQADAGGVYRLVVDNGLGNVAHETEVTVLPSTRLDALWWDNYLRFQINIRGEENRSFRIFASPNLQDWTLLTTVTNLTGHSLFYDTTENRPAMRFYKAEPLEMP
jgi:hypothetical protein